MTECFDHRVDDGGIRIFVGGGRDYYGETAERDAKVVSALGELLYEYGKSHGLDIELVTGGTKGIPNDFACHFRGPVLDVISKDESMEKEYVEMILNSNDFSASRSSFAIGADFRERRLGIFKLHNIRAAIFIQGGPYSTHEMLLFQQNNIPIVALRSGGGAAGSQCPYPDKHDLEPHFKNKVWECGNEEEYPYCLLDPKEDDAKKIAHAMADFVVAQLRKN